MPDSCRIQFRKFTTFAYELGFESARVLMKINPITMEA